MEVTLFGFIWLLFLLIALFRPISWIVFLLVLSGVFQATAVFNLSEKGFSPFFITQIFFIMKNLVSILNVENKMVFPDKGYLFLIIFFVFSFFGIFLLPNIFEGLNVFSPELGIDLNYLRGGSKLIFGGGNIAQCLYLFCNLTCLYQLYKIRSVKLFRIGINAFVGSIFLVLVIGFWEFSSKQFGVIYYPTSFISNNAGYALLNDLMYAKGISKLNASFIEPSFAGGYISAAFWGLFFVNKIWAKVTVLFLFIALCFNLSGTGFATFIIGGIICLLVFKRKYVLIFIPFAFILYYLISLIGYGDFILDTLLNKSVSQSGINRQGSNDFSIKIFIETGGLGVGLGSHRASSFIYTILATSGFLTLFFLGYLFSLLKTINKESILLKVNSDISDDYALLFRFGLVYFVSQCLAIPDLSNPTFWSWQYVAFLGVYSSKQKLEN